MKANIVVDKEGRYCGIHYECPGCEPGGHFIPTDWTPQGYVQSPDYADYPRWHFDGNLQRPTLSPSILSYCEWGPERRKSVCHSFVRDGRIEFLSDCTHTLAGQTVELPELSEGE
jgi:hypothetical protein